MYTYSELKDALLAESQRDEVGLWFIIGYVRDYLDVESPSDVRRITMDFVRDMLVSGKVHAGQFSHEVKQYVRWHLSPADTLARIESEWRALGRDPIPGEIVVFFGDWFKGFRVSREN